MSQLDRLRISLSDGDSAQSRINIVKLVDHFERFIDVALFGEFDSGLFNGSAPDARIFDQLEYLVGVI
jgi:hypothetical protein